MSDFVEQLRWTIGPEPLRMVYALGLIISFLVMIFCGLLSNLWSPLVFASFAALLGIAYFGARLIFFDRDAQQVKHDRWEARLRVQISSLSVENQNPYVEPHPGFGEIPNRQPKNPLMKNPLENS